MRKAAKRENSGFTLIELMIVVAILGIIAASSMAIYRQFIPKTQVVRVVSELSSLKAVFDERMVSSALVTNSAIGYVPSNLTTGNQGADVAVAYGDGAGHLEVTMGGNAHPAVSGTIVRLRRSASGVWTCVVDPTAASGWTEAYLPAGCSES